MSLTVTRRHAKAAVIVGSSMAGTMGGFGVLSLASFSLPPPFAWFAFIGLLIASVGATVEVSYKMTERFLK